MDNCVPAGMHISICRALTGLSSNTFIDMKRGRLVCKRTTNAKRGLTSLKLEDGLVGGVLSFGAPEHADSKLICVLPGACAGKGSGSGKSLPNYSLFSPSRVPWRDNEPGWSFQSHTSALRASS